MIQLIGIYGASGFGREVKPVLHEQLASRAGEILFIDDSVSHETCKQSNNVVPWEIFSARAESKAVSIAIANGSVRKTLYNRCRDAEIEMQNVVAANIFMGDDVTIGDGYILQPFTTLTSNISIGKCFHANIYSYVAHDCRIGDFVTFAPNVMCNGNVHIEDGAYIGAGAILRQGLPDKPLVIGAGAIVGMGAVVTKDVPPGATVVGNPARPLQR